MLSRRVLRILVTGLLYGVLLVSSSIFQGVRVLTYKGHACSVSWTVRIQCGEMFDPVPLAAPQISPSKGASSALFACFAKFYLLSLGNLRCGLIYWIEER